LFLKILNYPKVVNKEFLYSFNIYYLNIKYYKLILMDIEPLKSILLLYKDKDKVFQDYLDNETSSKLKNYYYYDEKKDDLYLDNNIITLSKTTGKIYKKGKIISINDNKISIKNVNNITFDSNEYYIFIKKQKYNKTNRDFYKALLNNLNNS
tara:strand:- start:1308 stop:1763 length:456 start_codon:yes stop_codon:yes gene_type:complete